MRERMRTMTLALAVAVAVAGCSHYDFDLSSDHPPWGDPSYQSNTAPQPEGPKGLARAPVLRKDDASAGPADYLLGPDDVVEVGILSLETPGKFTTLTRTVSHEGHISLPWVGNVTAAGLSAPQLEENVRNAYAGTYLKEPQVTVTVAEYRSVPIVISGAVQNPGLYYLKSNRSSVLECLALAGGPTALASTDLLIIRNGEQASRANPQGSRQSGANPARPPAGRETIVVDLRQLVDSGNMVLNLPVKAGDMLIVPSRLRRFIYVLGYVQRPGAYEIDEGYEVDALRAVALGGGLAGIARPGNSFLIRETKDGQQAIPVDLNEMARGELPPLRLKAGDTLVVGTTLAGRLSQFVAPSMGATVTASASVAP